MNAAKLIHQDSGDVEYYTPAAIVNAARAVMGSIDLDPASSDAANATVRADTYLCAYGLSTPWRGNVWLNHPFGRKSNPLWVSKAVDSFFSGDVCQLTCITFAATSEAWFAPLMRFPQCYLRPRTNYVMPDGKTKKGVSKGSVVTYMGANAARFAEVFARHGNVMVPAL